MTQEVFSAAFKGSLMTRAKLRGLKRNAAVVLGNVRTGDDADVLTRALDDAEPLRREHAAWAPTPLRRRGGSSDPGRHAIELLASPSGGAATGPAPVGRIARGTAAPWLACRSGSAPRRAARDRSPPG